MQPDDSSHDKRGVPIEAAMTPLHPNQIKVLRVRVALTMLFLVAVAAAADVLLLREVPVPLGLVTAAAALIALLATIWLPGRRYRAWGYIEGEDELHIRSGLWTRVRTAVPFGRVQHIDISQGPIERVYGLATLILNTAGTRGASVPLPGLLQPEAERMRDRIRVQIRQDLL